MPVALVQSEESSVIRLEGAIDIAFAAELKQLLLQAFESGGDVRIALDGATDLDVTAMQLLWASRRSAATSGVEFAFLGQAPEAVTSALLDAGFEDLAATMDAGRLNGVDR